jgi:hypothetical protein
MTRRRRTGRAPTAPVTDSRTIRPIPGRRVRTESGGSQRWKESTVRLAVERFGQREHRPIDLTLMPRAGGSRPNHKPSFSARLPKDGEFIRSLAASLNPTSAPCAMIPPVLFL